MKIKTGQFGSGLPNADWKLNGGGPATESSGNILISERVFSSFGYGFRYYISRKSYCTGYHRR